MTSHAQAKKILLLSAVSHEVACLVDDEGFPSFSWPGYHVHYRSVGVGLLAATLSLSEILAGQSYDMMLFTGSCGAPSGYALNSVIQPDRALLWQGQGGHYFPSAMEREFALDLLPWPENGGEISREFGLSFYQGGVAANPLAITSQELPSSRLAEQGIVAENLEVAACAYVARRWKLPMQAFLAVSNHIGPLAHEQWLQHHQKAQKQSCYLLMTLLKRGFL
jgi:nucleoside phosphorylase